jgi:hypothetical protein
MIDVECVCLSYKLAQLAKPEVPGIEIGGEVRKLSSDFSQRDPAIVTFHLSNDFVDDRDGRAW